MTTHPRPSDSQPIDRCVRCHAPRLATALMTLLAMLLAIGCGATKSQKATEQLLMSDAVDRAVAQIDFRALSGNSVYLDTTYMKTIKSVGFVNADYITSSLRQQLVAANCRLQDSKDSADYIVEARVGALGADAHEVTYGIPASSALSNAASMVPGAPAIPAIPEIAIAKRNVQKSAAKIAVFAYNRESREPVWQSGIAQSKSSARDAYILGAGPFQRGSIYDGTEFAGSRIRIPLLSRHDMPDASPVDTYAREVHFIKPLPIATGPEESDVKRADFEAEQPLMPAPGLPAKPVAPEKP